MTITSQIKPYIPNFVKEIGRRIFKNGVGIERYAFDPSKEVKIDIQEKYEYNGDLINIFSKNSGFVVHKWHHYIPLYDRYFSPYRGRKIRFLEIGVSKGGSLQMWRKYFGEEAIIFGIDIDPDCAQFDGHAGQVRIGSQADKVFLDSVVEEMGGVDVVLDDGSHMMAHVKASLKALFPKLSEGGIYMIEDLHTSYWRNWGGGFRTRGNFFSTVSRLIDDMHNWYHKRGLETPEISTSCSGIHIHDSIVVLEKSKVFPPTHSRNG